MSADPIFTDDEPRAETPRQRSERHAAEDRASALLSRRQRALHRQRLIIIAAVVAVLILAIGIPIAVHKHRQHEAAQRLENCLYYSMTMSTLELDLTHPECAG